MHSCPERTYNRRILRKLRGRGIDTRQVISFLFPSSLFSCKIISSPISFAPPMPRMFFSHEQMTCTFRTMRVIFFFFFYIDRSDPRVHIRSTEQARLTGTRPTAPAQEQVHRHNITKQMNRSRWTAKIGVLCHAFDISAPANFQGSLGH